MPSLHITNGDCAADTLRRVVSAPVAIMADVLHEGPCPPVDGDAWHAVRAGFLAGLVDQPDERLRAGLASGDRIVTDACARGDEIVLWFEHDLFDQLEVIRTLDLMNRARGPWRASLICIDRFPGVEPFYGLGQLSAEQLSTLVGTEAPITPEHLTVASAAWAAFRSADPRDLLAIAESSALPFLGAALRRFLAEYPSVDNGLNQTEEIALQALAAGPTSAGALFRAAQAREARPFLGDLSFFDMLHRLASARVPLVSLEKGPQATAARDHRVALTGAGGDVLARQADHVRLNGIDLWRGGVHLTGQDRSPWRWDARTETLVS